MQSQFSKSKWLMFVMICAFVIFLVIQHRYVSCFLYLHDIVEKLNFHFSLSVYVDVCVSEQNPSRL